MSAEELLLIDLSSLAYPIWHMSQSNPDPNATHTQVVDRVRALASAHPHAAVCCDSGRSFRHALDPKYKAQRPERDATLHHQIDLIRETLENDGFPVWMVKGFEADDVIASATAKALEIEGARVLIASADKDLLALVSDRVNALSLRDGTRIDPAWVVAKFDVTPAQMRDYLALVGDSSDNVVGAKGIGPKKACELLHNFDTVEALFAALDNEEAALPPSVEASIVEFRPRWPVVRDLVTLRQDVEIPFEMIAAERTPKDAAFLAAEGAEIEDQGDVEHEEEAPDQPPAPPPSESRKTEPPRRAVAPAAPAPRAQDPGQGLVKIADDVLAPAPADWGKQLEPRSMREAERLANSMHQARLFSGYGTPHAVLSTIMAGRELGFQSVASLRAFHIIDSKHSLAADALRALVLKSGAAKFFRIVERTEKIATWETWRIGDPMAIKLSYTLTQARAAWQKDQKGWDASGWGRHPEDMLSARASAKLARLVYPDVLFGLYAIEELRDDIAVEEVA
jgi:5'-3' exonuclease